MLSNIQILQIKNAIKRVLHVPGNYTGGILEMAIVADYGMSKEELSENHLFADISLLNIIDCSYRNSYTKNTENGDKQVITFTEKLCNKRCRSKKNSVKNQ